MSEGQSCECSKEELETWEQRVKIHLWAGHGIMEWFVLKGT